MTRYISQPVNVDRGAVRASMDDELLALVPGLEIPVGSQLDFLLDTFASASAADRQLFTEQLAIIFRYSGEKIDRVSQRQEVAATSETAWTRTLVDAQAGARTVDAGEEIVVTGLDGQPVAFRTTVDFTFQPARAVAGVSVANPAVVTTSVPHGLQTGEQVTISGVGGATSVNGTRTVNVLSATTFSVPVNNANAFTSGGTVHHVRTAVGAVPVAAIVGGASANGLQAGAAPALTLPWLASVSLSAPTSGGVDAEGDDEYLDRLSDTSPLRLNAIAKADDLARWLRNQSGVGRALAIDNHNGTTGGVPGHVLAVPVDDGGAALNPGILAGLQLAAQSITLTNLIVHLAAPTYTTVTVEFAGVAKPGWDPADVQIRAEAAVVEFLDPSRWGLPEQGDERLWLEKTTVRFQDVVTVLNVVDGFDYYTSLTINGGTGDVMMTGPGALPSSSSAAFGTVVAP